MPDNNRSIFFLLTVHWKSILWINPPQARTPVMRQNWKWLCGDVMVLYG